VGGWIRASPGDYLECPRLDERERQIVELRFFEEMTQSQIAAEIGISQMHVSRLLRRAIERMRGQLVDV
jgi:RNA polymerase sigma-B factor